MSGLDWFCSLSRDDKQKVMDYIKKMLEAGIASERDNLPKVASVHEDQESRQPSIKELEDEHGI